MKSLRQIVGSLALAAALLSASSATACPSCKEAVASQDINAARLSSGFSYSILLMIAMPLTLLGAGAFAIARASRRGSLPPL